MPRYLLAIVRTEYYPVKADTPEAAWEAYMADDRLGLCAPGCPGDGATGGVTHGHYVMAANDQDETDGAVLYAEGDLVPSDSVKASARGYRV